jgi:xylan 1,4-beta-xylosidase
MNKMTYQNPVRRGFFPDPSVIRVDSDCGSNGKSHNYYMVNSSFQYFPAIPISHSTDLVHWELIGHAITESSYLDLSEIMDSRGIWAPDISYHNGKFYIFATLRHNETDKGAMRSQLVMTSERPEGPYSKPIILPVDNIDPSHFVDDDGKHYMIIAPGVTVVPLNDDCTRVTGEPIQVWAGTGERCPEGPHILKKDGYYYAILAEGGTGYGHGINTARSTSLFGKYEPSPYNPVLRQLNPEAPLQRTGHGKLVETQNGDWWITYLCGRPNNGHYTTVGRETALDPVQWTSDGWFTVNFGNGPGIEQLSPDLPQTIFDKASFYDDFDTAKLDLNWEFVRNPDYTAFTLTERKGFARLYTQKGQLFELSAKNTLLHREEELCYTAETALKFDPIATEQAGLTCYYSTATYIRLSLCIYEGVRSLELVINRNHGEETVALVKNIPSGRVNLRVEVDHLTRKFYYCVDNADNYTPVGTVENCIFLCDEGVPGDPKRHTGTLVGIYANAGENGNRINADFDYFKYVNKK